MVPRTFILFKAIGLALAASLTAVGSARAADVPITAALDAINRAIGEQPDYKSRPRYALLVFGTNADTKVWMVEDGKRLYVDRNANGDLTDDAAPLVPQDLKEWKSESHDNFQFTYVLDQILPIDGGKHTDFQLHRWNYGKPEDSYGISVTVDGKIPMYAGWFGTFWADSPSRVPLLHFGGPLKPGLLGKKQFAIDSDAQRLSVGFFNPGRGDGANTLLSIYALPRDVVPKVEIVWPVAPGTSPLKTTHALSERCCYWSYYNSDFKVPRGVIPGIANARVTMPEGTFPYDLATVEMEITILDSERSD